MIHIYYECFKQYDRCGLQKVATPWSHSVCHVPEAITRDYEHFLSVQSTSEDNYRYGEHSDCTGSSKDGVCKKRSTDRLDLRVLRICRQFYNECNNVLWTTNIFALDSWLSFSQFMITRCHLQRELLRGLYINSTPSLRVSIRSPFVTFRRSWQPETQPPL